jgi:hypothetical protein
MFMMKLILISPIMTQAVLERFMTHMSKLADVEYQVQGPELYQVQGPG